MTVKYRVYFTESERGWGQDHWTTDYDTYDEARKTINELNARNNAEWIAGGRVTPDYYIQCRDNIEAVEV